MMLGGTMVGSPIPRRSASAAVAVALAVALSVSAASATTPPATGTKTGAQPPGLGLKSKAALAQEFCADTEKMWINTVGGGPACVNPWPEGKDNGGATAQGVTADGVKVVLYVPNEQMQASERGLGAAPPRNRATGATGTVADSIADLRAAFDHAIEQFGSYQLWGRTPEFEIVTAPGRDEASQRAGAVEVISRKPFMVGDMTEAASGGSPVFAAAVAARKIVVVSPSTTPRIGAQQSPYRWNYGADPDADGIFAAGLVGRSLSGKKARWAGDPELASTNRKFGVVYPTTGFDLDTYERLVKQNGGTRTTIAVTFDAVDPVRASEQAPSVIGRLKAAGVTSVVLFAPPELVTTLTQAATSQEFSPEWIFTGRGYHDFDGFARGYDQEQMRHAFGVGTLFPYREGDAPPAYIDLFNWYWGTGQGTTWPIAAGTLTFIYNALHYAGPTLTPQNVKKGLFAAPASGGPAEGTTYFQLGFGKQVGMPYDEYAQSGADRTMMWWDADEVGPGNQIGTPGTGKFMYLDGAERIRYEDLPEAEPKYFDASVSVGLIPTASRFPGGVIPEAAPCTGCPSAGGTG
jgi:hypothetical protein